LLYILGLPAEVNFPLLKAIKRYCETEYQEQYQVKMAQIGNYCQQLFFLILEEHPRDWHRPVAGILSLAKYYPQDVIGASYANC
jgi:hypothetical protein